MIKHCIFILSCTACFIQTALLHAQAGSGTDGVINAADTALVIETRLGKVRADRMLAGYLDVRIERLEQERKDKISGLETPASWQARRDEVRAFLDRVLGSPEQAKAVDPLVTGTVEGSGFRVEKILFKSRPSFYITADIYLPEGLPPESGWPVTIMHPLGVPDNGKASRKAGFREQCISLARSGLAVAVYDQIGQGERCQYFDQVTGGISWRPRPPAWKIYQSDRFDPELGETPGTAVLERSMLAGQSFLLGSCLVRDLAHDLSSVVDYLCQRPDIDTSAVFVVVPGGLAAAVATARDNRIKGLFYGMARGNCPRRIRSSSYPRVEGFPPETVMPGSVAAGVGVWDILSLVAPRPLYVMFYLADECQVLKNVYRSLGASGQLKTQYIIFDNIHWSMLSGWLAERTGLDLRLSERIDSTLSRALNVTETGQVSTALVAATVQQINGDEAERRVSKARGEAPVTRAEFLDRMRKQIRLERVISPPEARVTGRRDKGGYSIEEIILAVEPGISLPAQVFLPEDVKGKKSPALIYLGGNSAEYDVPPSGFREFLARQGFIILSFDPRGTGATAPEQNQWDKQGGFFAHLLGARAQAAYHALNLGTSLLELRIADVAAAAGYLASRKDVDSEKIACRGYGELASLALYSSLFVPGIKGVIYERGPVSFADMVSGGHTFFRPSSLLPGSVGRVDIDRAAAALAPRGLLLLNTVDGKKVRLAPARVQKELPLASGSNSLNITVADTPSERKSACLEWLSGLLR
ncbi:MAG: hypothetical protein U9P14_09955 [Gemmatimonadota bacterium]|nr:hypothetical protein [Gemmatimonadota bacterium]